MVFPASKKVNLHITAINKSYTELTTNASFSLIQQMRVIKPHGSIRRPRIGNKKLG